MNTNTATADASTAFDLFKFLTSFGINISADDCKFHFAKSPKQSDRDLFRTVEGFREFQSVQTARNFERAYVVAFYQWDDMWMFAGIWTVTAKPRPFSGENGRELFRYTTEILPESKPLFGRVVVSWSDRFRNSYPKGETLAQTLSLHAFLAEPDLLGRFPGYDSIRLSLWAIRDLVRNPTRAREWKTALSNVPGVYVIADGKTGKLYVGSAYGENGLWQRWEAYAETGHGSNAKLRKLLQDETSDYAFTNFVFSLLWYGGTAVSNEDVIHKESFWKEALMTREFGNNLN